MIFDKILHKNIYNYGIDYEFRKRNKGDSIEFYIIEECSNEKEYKFYVSSYRPLIKKSGLKNRNGDSDYALLWTDFPERIDDAFDKQMQWHYNRNVGLADVDYKISSLIINPHGIFFYSLGSNLYVHDLKISNYQFFNSTVLEKMFIGKLIL